jgi:hypothetical protein
MNCSSFQRLERELSHWPGVEHRAEHVGRHPRLWVKYGGVERFVPFSSTKVGKYGIMQKVTQLRRTLREMGAERE